MYWALETFVRFRGGDGRLGTTFDRPLSKERRVFRRFLEGAGGASGSARGMIWEGMSDCISSNIRLQ